MSDGHPCTKSLLDFTELVTDDEATVERLARRLSKQFG